MNPSPENSKASFGKKAKDYEKHAFVQSEAAAWLAEWLPMHACKTCLELGAGTGLLTNYLKNQFEHLECSDIEPAMVAICRSKFPTLTHRVRDAWAPQSDTGKWDLVTASSVLQWASNPQTVMQNWRKLLSPRGRILVGLFVEPSLPEMLEVTGGRSPLVWRDEDTWRSIFEAAGFSVVRMESKTQRYSYKSALELWKSVHGTGAAISQKLLPSQMIRFFRDYNAKYYNETGVYATWTSCRAELAIYSTP